MKGDTKCDAKFGPLNAQRRSPTHFISSSRTRAEDKLVASKCTPQTFRKPPHFSGKTCQRSSPSLELIWLMGLTSIEYSSCPHQATRRCARRGAKHGAFKGGRESRAIARSESNAR